MSIPSDPFSYGSLAKLPANLRPVAMKVSNFTGRNVKYEGNKTIGFEWEKYQNSITNITDGTISFDKLTRNTINQSSNTVSTMMDKIVAFLAGSLDAAISDDDKNKMKTNIQTTFENLKEDTETGPLSFNKTVTGGNTSWEYRIMFAFPYPDVPEYFYCMPCTIELIANVTTRESWWGLKSETNKNFAANITAMQVVVSKDFVIPP